MKAPYDICQHFDVMIKKYNNNNDVTIQYRIGNNSVNVIVNDVLGWLNDFELREAATLKTS